MNEVGAITVACLDLAGTTVADGGTVHTAFAEAIAVLGIVSGTAAHERALARFSEARGGSKIAFFRSLFDEPRAHAANLAFERSYDQLVDRRGLEPVPGADDALARVRAAGATHILPSAAALPDVILPAPVGDTVTADHR